MTSIPQELKNRKLWGLWLLLVILIVFLGRSALSEFKRWRAISRELGEREQKIEETSADIKKLSVELENSSDSYRVEKEARQTLNLKREGEEVLVVVGLEEIERPEDFSGVFKEPVETEGGVWLNIKKWWHYFFH